MLLGLVAAQPARSAQAVTRAGRPGRGDPARPGAAAPDAPPIEWIETKGPEVHPRRRSIRGALLSGPTRSTSCLPTAAAMRAQFDEDCPALDFYGGFYLQPDDDRLCAEPRRDPLADGRKLQDRALQQLVPKLAR